MRFTIDRIDHIVITCADLEKTASWYQRVLGMERETFGANRRTALRFGSQKLNLHQAGAEFQPNAAAARPGTIDICFITGIPAPSIVAHLTACGVPVEEGPVEKIGALGPMSSVYCRDPDGNLIEIASYLSL
ncbi:MAG TPA: VOC family protein [Acetobacteraceae bacterium]|nr:VOC family protein [Acetobacteraceae bacterium]